MISSELVLTSLIAFAMLAMGAMNDNPNAGGICKHHTHAKILDLVHLPYNAREHCGRRIGNATSI